MVSPLYADLTILILRAYRKCPNKHAGLCVDNLKTRSGYIQYYILKKILAKHEVKVDKSFSTLSDDQKCAIMRKLHDDIQLKIVAIASEMRKYIAQHQDVYQAEICNAVGLPNKVLNDNNYIGFTILSMMVEQDIISRYAKKNDRHKYFRLKNDIELKPVVFNVNACIKLYPSKAEAEMIEYLIANDYRFIPQYNLGRYRIDVLVYINQLQGSTLIERKILIELNGQQHYKIVDHFHRGEAKFKQQQDRDAKVALLAKEQGYELLIIRYDEKVTETFLKYI